MAEADAGREADGGVPPPWKLESSERVADYDMFRVRRDRARSPRNGTVREFSVAESPDGVTVLALTPGGELVMVEQFRHGPREVTLEAPSGVVDPGESPVEAAERELHEETGYAGRGAELLGTLLLNPSWQTTRVHVVRVQGAAPTGSRNQDEGEDIRVRPVPLGEVIERIRRGEVVSASVIAALLLLREKEER